MKIGLGHSKVDGMEFTNTQPAWRSHKPTFIFLNKELRGQNVEFCNGKAGGGYINHRGLNG
jgi:hypothetical protein